MSLLSRSLLKQKINLHCTKHGECRIVFDECFREFSSDCLENIKMGTETSISLRLAALNSVFYRTRGEGLHKILASSQKLVPRISVNSWIQENNFSLLAGLILSSLHIYGRAEDEILYKEQSLTVHSSASMSSCRMTRGQYIHDLTLFP